MTDPITEADILEGTRDREAQAAQASSGMGSGGTGFGAMARESLGQSRPSVRSQIRKERQNAAERQFQDQLKEARRQQSNAAQRVKSNFLGDIRGQGQRFGFNQIEATQAAGAVSQAGGGTGRAMAQQGMLPQIFAAQRMGMSANVGGAFLQGGRRGGVVGGLGRGGEAMENAIKEGMRIGLEGSELTNYMEQMAGDIRSWQQTGIPINTGSIANIGQTIAQSGVGGLRGSVMARQFAGKTRELGGRGPQSAAELAIFQEIGGFKGGGAEAVEEAQLRLEEGGGLEGEEGQKNFQRLTKRFFGAGGGGAAGRQTFRRAMRGLGVQVGIRESRLLQKQQTKEGLNVEEAASLRAAQDERITGAKAASGFSPDAVAAAMDKTLVKQAGITNRQIATGQKMIGVMQNLEVSSTALSKGFADLAGEPLTKMTAGIAALAEELPKAAERAASFLSGDIVGGLASGGGK